jgi:intermediate cleaving peptidase 55
MATCKSFARQLPRYLRRPATVPIIPRSNRFAGKLQNQAFIRRGYASISAAELKFGQPLHETHPHLLGPGEREFMLLHFL